MPNFRLGPGAREAIVTYLSSLRARESISASWDKLGEDRLKKGRIIYAKAGCAACHGPGGVGGEPNNNVPGSRIPGLAHVSEGFTREELIAKIRRGSKPEKEDPRGPEPLVSMPAWQGAIKDSEIEAVADYLLSLGPPSGSNGEW
jgi:mono/diheme cytochrome c family protein